MLVLLVLMAELMQRWSFDATYKYFMSLSYFIIALIDSMTWESWECVREMKIILGNTV